MPDHPKAPVFIDAALPACRSGRAGRLLVARLAALADDAWHRHHDVESGWRRRYREDQANVIRRREQRSRWTARVRVGVDESLTDGPSGIERLLEDAVEGQVEFYVGPARADGLVHDVVELVVALPAVRVVDPSAPRRLAEDTALDRRGLALARRGGL